MSKFYGNTTIASTYTPPETSQEMLLSLWTGQVTLHGHNTYNLILQTAEGLLYTTTETFDELIPYLKKYYKKGYLNTGGRDITKYINKVLKKYTVTDYPNRPAYLLFVNGEGKFNRGENKIMGVTAEGLQMVKDKAKELKADTGLQARVAETDPIKALMMMLDSLKDK